MTQDPLLEEKNYYADIIFKNLNSLTRSEDTSLDFYGMALENQNATEEGFKKFSALSADLIIEKIYKLKGKGKNPSNPEVEKIIKDSFGEAWKKYNEKGD